MRALPAVLVVDDLRPMPDELAAWVGVDRFGRVLHDRLRHADRLDAVGQEAGFRRRIRLSEPRDRAALLDELAEAPEGARYVWVETDVAGPAEALARCWSRLALSGGDAAVRGAHCWGLRASTFRRLLSASHDARRAWWADRRADVDEVTAEGLVSLTEPAAFMATLSGAFTTRAFNAMEAKDRTLRKRSADAEKIAAEHDFYHLLPIPLRRFFVMPFDLQRGEGGASYRMERLVVPDAALLWVHGADGLGERAFGMLLDALGAWFEERPRRAVQAEEATRVAEALYVEKVRTRLDAVLRLVSGKALDATLRAGGRPDGLGGLLERYLALRTTLGPSPTPELAVTHGDLCLSNVLFDPRTGLCRFIDPRGATDEAGLWSDPVYDAAKLSHSVLGGYDFVNNGLFDVQIDDALGLRLVMDRPAPGARESAFEARLATWGFDPVRVRLCEASLFLSMLPLHAEAPRKLLGFALVASAVLDDVERRLAPPSWFGR